MRQLSPALWTPVALTNGLHNGEVRPAFTSLLSIALWRDQQGVAHAMHTRCPHRGMNLAYGFVREQNIACAYHGWQYDADGQCVYIPAHPDLPPARSICTTVYGCTEAGGVVFVRENNSVDALPPEPPQAQTGVRSVAIDATPETVYAQLGANDNELWITPSNNNSVICAVQALPDSRTAVHTLMSEADVSIDARIAAARWACEFRDGCETTATGGN